ncbi:MAG: tRNA(Ile)-lysidine [Gallionellaceae bacterium]|nr:MAG: tRNA(Ile)-lysidine [Gallionellaceae bacterium]
MASLRKSKFSLVERVADALLLAVPPKCSILLGLSGGMDSVVLLHLLHTLAPRFDWQISALHVHHGISPNADTWANFCTGLCTRYAIPLHVEHVDIAPLRDAHGIEAAARKLRHAAFVKQSCDFVALAQHADDQAETLLLQLLRGAGVKGAAAMPLLKPANQHVHATLRPLLDTPRSALLEYAQQHSLQWVEDESNTDDSYPRNFLRHRVLPQLEQRFPAYRATLARGAQHFAEAAELLDELAQQDAQEWVADAPLDVSLLRTLSHSRGKNLLRYFLHRCGAPMPQDGQLDDMLRQLCTARQDAAVCVGFGDWQVHRYQDKIYALRALGEFDQSLLLQWSGEAELEWPALNLRLMFSPATGQGISHAKLQRAPVSLRLRSGGEALRPHPKAATRSLKNLLQECHVPPWQRERLPLLYCGDELVCVVGVATAAAYQAQENEASMVVSLLP